VGLHGARGGVQYPEREERSGDNLSKESSVGDGGGEKVLVLCVHPFLGANLV